MPIHSSAKKRKKKATEPVADRMAREMAGVLTLVCIDPGSTSGVAVWRRVEMGGPWVLAEFGSLKIGEVEEIAGFFLTIADNAPQPVALIENQFVGGNVKSAMHVVASRARFETLAALAGIKTVLAAPKSWQTPMLRRPTDVGQIKKEHTKPRAQALAMHLIAKHHPADRDVAESEWGPDAADAICMGRWALDLLTDKEKEKANVGF